MALAPGPNLSDVCSFGHQLVPGSDPITITTYDGDRKVGEETKLLRRHAVFGIPKAVSRTDPSKVVAYPCDHALPEGALLDGELPEYHGFRGKSYGRAHWLTFGVTYVTEKRIPIISAKCPVCLGQPAPTDWRA